MFCCITGEAPKEPVVSRLSGHLYEKSIIVKYIQAEGKCPITGNSLHETDLLHIACHPIVRPKVATSASIPGMLSMLQNEWDDVMLEMFTLKQHLGNYISFYTCHTCSLYLLLRQNKSRVITSIISK